MVTRPRAGAKKTARGKAEGRRAKRVKRVGVPGPPKRYPKNAREGGGPHAH
jgi:hypothetical protein